MITLSINKISLFILRALSSLIFIAAGINHFNEPEKITGRLQKAKLGYLVTSLAPADIMVTLSGVGLLAGGVLLLIGYKTKIAAALLIFLLLPITITIQLFSPEGTGPLFKNIAIFGSLVFFLVNGSMVYSADTEICNRRQKNLTT